MNKEKRTLELLAPAKNLQCAIEAIENGADAIYIGANEFSARSAASNSLEDISKLVEYAHRFGVKIYVALNTILKDEELPQVEKLIWALYENGVDALIIQDMGITQLSLPPIPLHASTQMDNRTKEKVEFLTSCGFSQVVLARELSLNEIKEIHQAVPQTPLEVFVHGSLCVSYSGCCYVSEYCFGRSANRGECSQVCRHSFDLFDGDNNILIRDKHLLSLKDMNRSHLLQELIDAGVSSFKIEGRLKDATYVKNITAYYRQKLDEIIDKSNKYKRSSVGISTHGFTPSPEKSFNRGFTDYLSKGHKDENASFHTPKSLGEPMGEVSDIHYKSFTVRSKESFSNGDGLCFFDRNGQLHGFRLNKVEGNLLYPSEMPQLFKGTMIYRNFNHSFEKELSQPNVKRKIGVDISFSESENGFILTGITEHGIEKQIFLNIEKQLAKTDQTPNINNQLGKWGNTIFSSTNITINLSNQWFIPSSHLAEARRQLAQQLQSAISANHTREQTIFRQTSNPYIQDKISFMSNVYNRKAHNFYSLHSVKEIEDAFELKHQQNVPLMTCKHCLRHTLGWCSKEGGELPYKEPLKLVSRDNREFFLQFDCKACVMKVYATDIH